MTKLRQRMIEDMEIRNLSHNTQLSYLQQVSSFARYFQRSPEAFGPEKIRAYQVHLATERKLTPGSLCIIASALRFVYKVPLKRTWVEAAIPLPKKPFKLPVILSREEVDHFFESIASLKHRTILAALRVSEHHHCLVSQQPYNATDFQASSNTPQPSNHRLASTNSPSMCRPHPSTATTSVDPMPITPPSVERLSTDDFLLSDRGPGNT